MPRVDVVGSLLAWLYDVGQWRGWRLLSTRAWLRAARYFVREAWAQWRTRQWPVATVQDHTPAGRGRYVVGKVPPYPAWLARLLEDGAYRAVYHHPSGSWQVVRPARVARRRILRALGVTPKQYRRRLRRGRAAYRARVAGGTRQA